MNKTNEELNRRLYIDKNYLNLNTEAELNFKLYPTEDIINHCGYIKNFECLNLQIKLQPVNQRLIKGECKLFGEVEAFELDSAKSFKTNIEDFIEIYISDDINTSDLDKLSNGDFDVYGLAVALLYSADLDIYEN